MAAQATEIGTGIVAMGSNELWTAEHLANLPDRLDDAMLGHLSTIASAPLPALPACSDDHFAKCIRAMAILPRQHTDDVKGELQVRLYQRKLGHLPAAQISFIADQALERFDWFPSIKQCLEVAADWRRTDMPVQVKARAEALARREREARLDDARQRIRTERCEQDWIDALPDRTKAILEAENMLWRCDECGSFTQRGQWREKPGEPLPALPAMIPRREGERRTVRVPNGGARSAAELVAKWRAEEAEFLENHAVEA